MNDLESVIDETKETLNNIRPCYACIFSNEECTWCRERKLNINPNMTGCNTFMTKEDAVRKIAEIEYEKFCKEVQQRCLDLDIMGYTINAASIMLEKIDQKLEASYAALKNKTDSTVRNHAESKKNRDRLRKAYLQMKAYATDMRNTYNKYVEYFFTHQFTDETGKYNCKEADKNLANSGSVSKVIKLFVDRALDNDENATKILDFMLSLQGSGIYDEQDFNSGIIRN